MLHSSLLEKMISKFKEKKIPISKVEKDLGFSNGQIGKAAKGVFVLSEEKSEKLKAYCKDNGIEIETAILVYRPDAEPELPPKFNPKVEEIKSSIEGVTTGDKIPVPRLGHDGLSKQDHEDYLRYRKEDKALWGEIKAYCDKNGITPQDLITAHKAMLANFNPVEVKTSKIKDVVDNIKKATEKALESKESAAKFLSDAGITENKNSPKYDRRKVKLGF